METPTELNLPEQIVASPQLLELEYYGENPAYRGLLLDLNDDGLPDFIVASAPSLCGNAGCTYALFDGRTFKPLGVLFGNPIFVRSKTVNGYRVVNVYGRMNAASGRYATYVVDDSAYVNVSTVTVSGDDIVTLFDELRRIPTLPPGGRP